ncbi:hypothetical protein BVRB_2g030300 [Beta vulgaris subsp. vulgaris]|nr:hypothetical protein BVRB_2g030300 [Beta vulgaris subsp. vulgaris]
MRKREAARWGERGGGGLMAVEGPGGWLVRGPVVGAGSRRKN